MSARPSAALGLVALAAAALLVFAGGRTRADDEPDGGVAPSDIHTAAGKVSAVAWDARKLTLDAPDGPLTLTVDRNTTVYLESRLGSLRDVAVGLPVRVSFGPEKRAFWIEVRPRGVVPPPDRAAADGGPGRPGGAPPDVLPPPPRDGGGAGEGEGESVPDGGGAVPDAGPSGESGRPPEPRPGAPEPPPVPPEGPRPPAPGPTGPGPVPGGPVRR